MVVKPKVTPPPAAPKANATATAKAKAKALATAKATARAKAQAKARAKAKARAAAARKKASRTRARVNQFDSAGGFAPPSTPPTLTLETERAPGAAVPAAPKAGGKRDLLTSPAVRVLMISAATLAVVFLLLAALPLVALERLLAVEAHYRAEQVANFVDGHRLDIAVAGIASLLVAAVVAIPTVTG